jgi:hypothetical protein
MVVFDALFGLTAIALANPSSKAPILTELFRDADLAPVNCIGARAVPRAW